MLAYALELRRREYLRRRHYPGSYRLALCESNLDHCKPVFNTHLVFDECDELHRDRLHSLRHFGLSHSFSDCYCELLDFLHRLRR